MKIYIFLIPNVNVVIKVNFGNISLTEIKMFMYPHLEMCERIYNEIVYYEKLFCVLRRLHIKNITKK